jgi:hypothetical protein
MGAAGGKNVSDRMRSYRERQRKAGLRLVQIWVPDAASKQLAREARRQSLLVSRHASERSTMEFLEDVADTRDWRE